MGVRRQGGRTAKHQQLAVEQRAAGDAQQTGKGGRAAALMMPQQRGVLGDVAFTARLAAGGAAGLGQRHGTSTEHHVGFATRDALDE